MLRQTVFAFAVVVLCSAMAFAQNGSVQGFVYRSDGRPAVGADVDLDAVDGGHHHPFHGGAFTDPWGAFMIHMVPPGAYNISASMRFEGFASDLIDVVAGQTTHVTLTLQDPDSGNHGGGLVPVNLDGTAIVTGPDSLHRNYFLDTNNDGTPEYRLAFGPWWYNPPGPTRRPLNGQHITIFGGLFSYGSPQMVVVWDINGHYWRDPVHGGHGGYGGDHGSDCDPDSVTRVELAGQAIVTEIHGWHGEHHSYALDINHNLLPDYLLDFGADDYAPGNGATRPHNGENDSIVGGQIQCLGIPIPIVIVYEINGLFWRQPGDTTGMGPMNPDAAENPIPNGVPVSYLTAHNYPNPFNPTTTISYSIPVAGHVEIAVFDITGRQVAKLVDRFETRGSYAVAWDGSAFASGIYLYRVTVNNVRVTNRMVLMK